MTGAVPKPTAPLAPALIAGLLLGVLYTLSPLTVAICGLLLAMTLWVRRDLNARERRWLYAVMIAAVLTRLAVIAGLFLSASDGQPFATFFGDEEMFKNRSIWLRNIGLGVPISSADFIYALEETGKSHYLFVLAFLGAMFGDVPYGVHVFNMGLYITAALLLYRVVRTSYGPVPALGGLLILLFLPTLFIWSISALKEPLYTVLAAIELVCALQIVRSRAWGKRLLAIVVVVLIAFALEGLRKGGMLVALVGSGAGLLAAAVVTRPRLLLPAMMLVPIGLVAIFTVPAIEQRVLSVLRDSAIYHVGHVFTPGYSYRTLDAFYYVDPADVRRMEMGDALMYALRSAAAYVLEPLPWTIESRTALVYLPEHMLWLCLAALVPVGAVMALRRDAALTCLLVTHAAVLVMMVALTSGNVGTLIRHRGLAMPYLVWLSAVGACEALRWLARRPVATGTPTRLLYANR
jgi:hypothetical protein